MKIKSITNPFIMLLAILGCVISGVLTFEHFVPAMDIGCRKFGGDCAAAGSSSYGHLGPIPTALFGMAMYLTILFLCWVRQRALRNFRSSLARDRSITEDIDTEAGSSRPPSRDNSGSQSTQRRKIALIDGALWLISLTGAFISWWLQFISLFQLFKFCPWCMASAVLISLILLLCSRDFLFDDRKLNGEQKLLIGVSSVVFLLMGFIFAPMFLSQLMSVIKHGGTPVTDKPTVIPVNLRRVVLSSNRPVMGPNNAKFTIVEFADYQCSHCKEATAGLNTLIKTNKVSLKLEFRNFPLDKHIWARPAAAAAAAAAEQHKFWEMHDLIFEHQDEMEKPEFKESRFTDFATMLNLNVDKFKKDMVSDKVVQSIVEDIDDGDKAGTEHTPTFFLVTPTKVTRYAELSNIENIVSTPDAEAWK